MGAIVDPSQRKSIDDYVQQAKSEGADVYQAYATMPSNGCYYPPTLITKVQPVSICVQEEVSFREGGREFYILSSSLISSDIWSCIDCVNIQNTKRSHSSC